MRWILSASFFNQHQKFFVPGRAEEGRFGHTAPLQLRLSRHEFPQVAQHSLVDGRVGDHPGIQPDRQPA